MIAALLVVVGVIAVGVVCFLVFRRKAQDAAPPATLPAAVGAQWRPIGADPRLVARIPGGTTETIGAAADTTYRGRYAVAFTYGQVRLTAPRPTVAFTAIVSVDLVNPLPPQEIERRLAADPRARYYPVRVHGSTICGWTPAGADRSLPWQRVNQLLDLLTGLTT